MSLGFAGKLDPQARPHRLHHHGNPTNLCVSTFSNAPCYGALWPLAQASLVRLCCIGIVTPMAVRMVC